MVEKDYIGPDPVVWIERLYNVVTNSAFCEEHKALILSYLNDLQQRLEGLADRVEICHKGGDGA